MHVTAHAPLRRQPLFRHSLGLSVDSPILSSSAGGIRTHGLELMRLARTAELLYRATISLAGWSRTSDLRCPKPAGWPSPLQPGEKAGGGSGFPQPGAETSPLCESSPKPSVARRHACQPPVAAAGDPPLSDAGCTLRPTLRAAVVPSLHRAVRRRLGLSALSRQDVPDAALAASGKSTTVESNHA